MALALKGDVDMDMELPEAAGLIGTIENDRIIYIEDYALQYLKLLDREERAGGDKYVLYGNRGKNAGKDIYIIYGICKQEELKFCRKGTGKEYEWIGNLASGGRRSGEEFGRILLAENKKDRQSVNGCYIFYDADDKMKERLGEYYEESINRSRYKQMTGKQAELVALSSREETEGVFPYLWLRIAVTGILIIFCAIAVTTVNRYDKISDFVQAAVRTGEMIEEPENN